MRLLKCQKGTAMLEFAMIMPLFFFFILAIINFSILLYNDFALSEVARTTARLAAITGDEVVAEERGVNDLKDMLFVEGRPTVEVSMPIYQREEDSRTQTNVAPIQNTIVLEARTPVMIPGFAAMLGGNVWDKEVKRRIVTTQYVEYSQRTRFERMERIPRGYAAMMYY